MNTMFTRLVENITVLLTEAEKLTDELDGAAATTMNRTIKQFMADITDLAEQIEQGAGDPAKPPILACQPVLCLSSAQSELSHARDCIRLAAAYEPDASVINK